MRNYEMGEIKNKSTKNKLIVSKTIRIKAKNKDLITYDEIRAFLNSLVKKGMNASKISIGGMNADKFYTMKTFDEDELKPWDDDDYYKDRVKDTTKFDKFMFVDFNIRN